MSYTRVYYAPGRVNLLGEHTDYNGGRVLPCALNRGVICAVEEREDDCVGFAAKDYSGGQTLSLRLSDIRDLASGKEKMEDIVGLPQWLKYPLGVVLAFEKNGYRIGGINMFLQGNVPVGAGLSSSAAVCVAVGTALNKVFGHGLKPIQVAKLAQMAENEYVGCNCGIMDQFASAMGQAYSAIALDTATEEYELIPMSMGEIEILITNTMVKHELANSEYNKRREECEKALEHINEVAMAEDKTLHYNNLCELVGYELLHYAKAMKEPGDDVLIKRAKHVVFENQRAVYGTGALLMDDFEFFGKMMYQSHASLRDDYEVSCEELDFLVDLTREVPGVYGSRMTGGGFGGCTVTLIEHDAIDQYIRVATERYQEKFGVTPEFYTAIPGEGARRIEE